jgi:SAM-dependent methyltransferase
MTAESNRPDASRRADVRRWWAEFPMTYGEEHGNTLYGAGGEHVDAPLGSREFFEKADATLYRWNEPLHGPEGPFSRLFDYPAHRGKRVLEVGCGMGCMAMNWARQGAVVSAVDLNPVAVAQTRTRFEIFGLSGDIREADAAALPYADASFDYVYSWGVLHHSPDLRRSLDELHRVMRPGARIGVMLYNRESLLFRFLVRWQEGCVNLERRWLDELALASRYGDGERREGNPHTWPVTQHEIRTELFTAFDNVDCRVLGTDVPNVLNIWGFELGSRVMPRPAIDALARRWGWSLWATGARA